MAVITVPGMFLTGDHASRPAANTVGSGSLYSCSTHSLVYQSDGSSWSTWATLGTGDATTHIADTTDAHDASAVSFDATGLSNTSATEVQTALEDLDGAITAGGASNFTAARKLHVEGSNYTTASTSFVDVDATDLSITITTGARRALIVANVVVSHSTSARVDLDVDLDGARLGQTLGLASTRMTGTGILHSLAICHLTAVLSAASHTFKLQWKTDTGTATMYSTAAITPVHFAVTELYSA